MRVQHSPRKWEQIASDLRDRIAAGEIAAGHRMPQNYDLAKQYRTSRATVALSLARLGREGWVVFRDKLHGWAVAEQPRRRRLSRNRLSSAERARGRGFFLTDAADMHATPEVETTVCRTSADADTAARLEIDEDELVVQRHRVMSLDGAPAQIAVGSVPATIAADTALEQEHPGDGGIVARLADLDHAPVRHIERVIPERLATETEARLLALPAESTVCEIVRISYDADDGPVLTEHIVMGGRTVELVYEIPAH